MIQNRRALRTLKQNMPKHVVIHCGYKCPKHELYLYSKTIKNLKEYKY